MAYTIISQNNTTTTLSDENGNVITVPARVTLATSTDYTIIKVNNNSVDLESGDGKIIRGVPACVVLAGEGGGGGGSVDYSKTVQKTSSMPVASADNAGQVFLYTGATDANYTQNYIYKNVKSATYTGEIFFAMAVTTSVDCSVSNFANFIVSEGGADPTLVTRGGLTYKGDNLWELVARDSNGDLLCTIREYTEDFEDAGFVFTGTPVVDDSMSFDCTIIEASATYTWTRIDVQPAPSGLPDQTGNAGKFLTTDGTDASWGTINALQNTATGTGALGIGDTGAVSGDNSLVIGAFCQSYAAGEYGVAIGYMNGVYANRGIALGCNADAGAIGAIEISSASLNRANYDPDTFKVGNSNGNFEIMSADGTVPTARLTKVNTTATLAVADWSSSTQTVTVSGVKADSVVFVSPAPASASDYASAGILCTAQAADSLTFTCTTTPSSAITVNVVCM